MKITEIAVQTTRIFEVEHNKRKYSVCLWFEEGEYVDHEVREQLKGGDFSYDVAPDVKSYIVDKVLDTLKSPDTLAAL
jgi:hypothetical protein